MWNLKCFENTLGLRFILLCHGIEVQRRMTTNQEVKGGIKSEEQQRGWFAGFGDAKMIDQTSTRSPSIKSRNV